MAKKTEATLLIKIKEQGGKVIDDLQSKITGMKVMGVAAFAAIAAFVFKATQAYAEQERSIANLTNTMVSQGVFTTELKDKYVAMADSLSKLSGASGEQIMDSQAVLQSYIGQTEVTERLQKAVIALSLKKKIDLVQAAELVGKTIGGETNMMARQGIVFDNTAKGGDRMVQVLTAIEGKTGGALKTNLDGITGATLTLNERWGDFLKAFGSRTAPVFEAVTRSMAKFLELVTPDQAPKKIDDLNKKITEFEGVVAGIEKKINVTGGSFIDRLFGVDEKGLQKRLERANAILAEARGQRQAILDEGLALENESNQNAAQLKADAALLNREKIAEDAFKDKEAEMAGLAAGNSLLIATDAEREMDELTRHVSFLDKKLSASKSFQEKLVLQKQKEADLIRINELKQAKEKVQLQKDTFATIATLSSSNNSALAAVGKAAAITQIAIDTPVAISKALAAFPPPFNFAAAGAVGIAMAAQAARIAGVPLAEGGVVLPRPGGTQAIIGEAGQAEAVIPLDKFGGGGGFGGNTINFYGPVMGDESQARRFAEVLDRELYNMRKSNSSLSFEGII